MKSSRYYPLIFFYAALAILIGAAAVWATEDGKIVHDAEYYILEAQNGERWAAEDNRS